MAFTLQVKTHKQPHKSEIAELVEAVGRPVGSEYPGEGGHFFTFVFDTQDEADAADGRVESIPGSGGYCSNVDEYTAEDQALDLKWQESVKSIFGK